MGSIPAHPARKLTCNGASFGCDLLGNTAFHCTAFYCNICCNCKVDAGLNVCLSTILTVMRGMQGMKERMSTLASSLGLGGQGNPMGLGQ